MPWKQTGGHPPENRDETTLGRPISARSGLTFAILLACLILIAACKSGDGDGGNTPGGPSPTATDSSPFILSEEQKVHAIRIIGDDGRVADLINRNKDGIGKFPA